MANRCVRAAVLALSVTAACGHVDERTAVEHEALASRYRGQSSKAEATVRTLETTQPVLSGSESARAPGPGLEHYAAGSASQAIGKAKKHEEEARRIRQAAAIACRNVPAKERASCPIHAEGARVESTADGARIVPATPPAAENWRAQIGCALAEAQVDHPGDAATCPLLAPGAVTRIIDRPGRPGEGGVFVEITSQSGPQADEIRRRAREAVRRSPAPPATVMEPEKK